MSIISCGFPLIFVSIDQPEVMRLEIHSKASLFHFDALSKESQSFVIFSPIFLISAQPNTHTHLYRNENIAHLFNSISVVCLYSTETAFWWCSKCIMIYLLSLTLSLSFSLRLAKVAQWHYIAYLCMSIIHIWPFILWHKYTWCYTHTTPTANRTNQLMAKNSWCRARAKRKCNA